MCFLDSELTTDGLALEEEYPAGLQLLHPGVSAVQD